MVALTLAPCAAPCRGPRGAVRAARARVAACALQPVGSKAEAFAPATVANLGPGFDWMGCAVAGDGDTVTARAAPELPAGTVIIEHIDGDGGRLSRDPEENCVGIAAKDALRMMGGVACGVALSLHKRMPLGSGLGSSAASAAAAAEAVNALFGSPLSKDKLVLAGLTSEATVSGYHADNIAPAVLGGFVLVRSCDPLEYYRLAFPGEMHFVLVNPKFEAPTKEMRAALSSTVTREAWIQNASAGGMLVAGILQGDAEMVGRALDSDRIVEPVRGKLIPGFFAVKDAAKRAGAFGCTISGAGPTCVAIVGDAATGERVKEAMAQAFVNEGKLEVNIAKVTKLDSRGAFATVK